MSKPKIMLSTSNNFAKNGIVYLCLGLTGSVIMMSVDKASAKPAVKETKPEEPTKQPKKALHKVSSVSKMKILTKDAKQMVNGPYYCPKCRKEVLQMYVDSRNKKAYAVCKCGLEWELTYAPVFQGVDYYNKFRDAWKKQSYGIIKQPPK